MHPLLAHRRTLGLYLTAWIPIAGLLAGLLVYSGHLSWVESLLVAVPMSAIYAFLCLSAWYLCRGFPVDKTGVPRLFGIFAIAAMVSSSLWLLIGRLLVLFVGAITGLTAVNDTYTTHVPLLLVVGILLYFLAVAVHYLMSIFESSRRAEKEALELQILAREAELRALKAQIDPHFLFNSLNSISALTAIDPGASRSMCQLLADFLRKSLDLGARDLISLDEELTLASSYLAIEQVRLGPRLAVRQEIGPSSRNCKVPPLLLQPLVENAVRHGIARLLEGGEISLATARRSGLLEIRVKNPCDPDAPAKMREGIGLTNVRRRIRTLYAADAGLDLRRTDDWFEAVVTIPVTESHGSPQPVGSHRKTGTREEDAR